MFNDYRLSVLFCIEYRNGFLDKSRKVSTRKWWVMNFADLAHRCLSGARQRIFRVHKKHGQIRGGGNLPIAVLPSLEQASDSDLRQIECGAGL